MKGGLTYFMQSNTLALLNVYYKMLITGLKHDQVKMASEELSSLI